MRILPSETAIVKVKILFLIWGLVKSSHVKPAERKGRLYLLKKYMFISGHTQFKSVLFEGQVYLKNLAPLVS